MSSESDPESNGPVEELLDGGAEEEEDDGGSNTALLIGLAVVAVVMVPILALAAIIIGSAVLGAFVLGVGEQPPEQPQLQLAFDETAAGVQITHAGGDSVRAGALLVTVDGQERTWAAIADADSDDRIVAGDSVTVSASRGDRIRVVWQGDDTTAALGSYRVEQSRESPAGARSAPVAAPA